MRMKMLLAATALLLTACGPDTGSVDQAPSLTIKVPEEYVDPSVVDVSIVASDQTGLSKITIQRDDSDDGVDNFTTLKTIVFNPPQTSYNSVYSDTIPGNGKYFYRVIAENKAGSTRTNTLELPDREVPVPLTSLGGTLVEPSGAFAFPLTTTAWTGGAGQVVLETNTASEITRSPLGASGQFTLNLTAAPSAAQKQLATPQNLLGQTSATCTGDAASSNPNVGMTVAHLRVAANKSGLAAPFQWLEPITAGDAKISRLSVSSLIYVDQAVKFSGSLTCVLGAGKDPIAVNLPLHLYKGWNKATVQTVTNSLGQITSISWSYDFPKGTNDQWVLLPQTIPTTP